MLAERIMESFFPKLQPGEKPRRSKSLTASIITGCPRRNWYVIKGIPGNVEYTPDYPTQAKFFDGNVQHSVLTSLLNQEYDEYRVRDVKLIKDEFPAIAHGLGGVSIYSRVDFQVCLDEILYVNGEFKTMAENPYMTWMEETVQAFPSYYAQCQVCLQANPANPFLLLVKNKNTSEYNEELVAPDTAFMSHLFDIKRSFDRHITNDTLPERPYRYGTVECKGCEYLRRCWYKFIMEETADVRSILPAEIRVIKSLLRVLGATRETRERYDIAHEELQNYMGWLHQKYQSRYIRLPIIRSTWVSFTRETPNLDRVKRLLTPVQYRAIMKGTKVEFPRVTW